MPVVKRVDVISNDTIDAVLAQLDVYMGQTDNWQNFTIEITSGVRTPVSQLHIIAQYASQKSITFDEFDPEDCDCKTTIDGAELYCWQRTWSKLLNVGIIINPCYDAICLFDYFSNGVNKKGQMIHQSPHMKGTAFDISGKAGLDNITHLIDGAMKYGIPIKSYTIERENNAFHCNILTK